MMQKSQVSRKLIINIISIIAMALFINNAFFANTYKKPEVIIGPASSEPDAVKIDETNFAFDSFSKLMSYEDSLKAIVYISEFRKGDKTVEQNLKDLISKYNPVQAEIIVHYMLYDNVTKLVSAYIVDHKTNTVRYVKVTGLTADSMADAEKTGKEAWEKFISFVPDEFRNSIDYFYIELYKQEDSMITICEIDEDAKRWGLYFDARLLFDEYKNDLFEQSVYSTVYYYVLRNDQIANNSVSNKNYSYGKHYYKDDSYINKFYEKYWKGRRKEINLGQYDLYPNDFINNKASRTVYDDMAVSFYYYMMYGQKKGSELIKDKKLSFFVGYEIFDVLKKFFNVKKLVVGINYGKENK